MPVPPLYNWTQAYFIVTPGSTFIITDKYLYTVNPFMNNIDQIKTLHASYDRHQAYNDLVNYYKPSPNNIDSIQAIELPHPTIENGQILAYLLYKPQRDNPTLISRRFDPNNLAATQVIGTYERFSIPNAYYAFKQAFDSLEPTKHKHKHNQDQYKQETLKAIQTFRQSNSMQIE
jgi:hypothetical protein